MRVHRSSDLCTTHCVCDGTICADGSVSGDTHCAIYACRGNCCPCGIHRSGSPAQPSPAQPSPSGGGGGGEWLRTAACCRLFAPPPPPPLELLLEVRRPSERMHASPAGALRHGCRGLPSVAPPPPPPPNTTAGAMWCDLRWSKGAAIHAHALTLRRDVGTAPGVSPRDLGRGERGYDGQTGRWQPSSSDQAWTTASGAEKMVARNYGEVALYVVEYRAVSAWSGAHAKGPLSMGRLAANGRYRPSAVWGRRQECCLYVASSSWKIPTGTTPPPPPQKRAGGGCARDDTGSNTVRTHWQRIAPVGSSQKVE